MFLRWTNTKIEVRKMNNNALDGVEIPQGLSMALAQDLRALNRFAGMSHSEQVQVINRARSARSKEEMRSIVSDLV